MEELRRTKAAADSDQTPKAPGIIERPLIVDNPATPPAIRRLIRHNSKAG